MRGNFEVETSQYPVAVAHVGLNDIQVVNLVTSEVHTRETKLENLVGRKEQTTRLEAQANALNREIRETKQARAQETALA